MYIRWRKDERPPYDTGPCMMITNNWNGSNFQSAKARAVSVVERHFLMKTTFCYNFAVN